MRARLSRPVLAYGLLELGDRDRGARGAARHRRVARLYVALFGGQEALPDAGGLATALFYLACSFPILLVRRR